MNKNAIFAHFSRVIDNMVENSLFFDTFFLEPQYMEDIEGSVDNEALPENISMHFGATRGCIIDDDYDYVVKFDIEGDAISDSICEREVGIYSRAKQANLHSYFAAAEYLGCYTKTIMFHSAEKVFNAIEYIDYYDEEDFTRRFTECEDEMGEIVPVTISIPLYGYPKATRHNLNHSPSKDLVKCANSIASPIKHRKLEIATDFIKQYGMEAYGLLSTFMYEENINDLHMGNIGDVDGHLVFIDYSGYHSCDCSERPSSPCHGSEYNYSQSIFDQLFIL